MSQVNVNAIYDASGGSNAVLHGVAAPDNSMGFRNRIINGDMRIDQRNAGASVTPTASGYFSIDRWRASLSVASKYSMQQNAGEITPPSGFTNYLGMTSTSAYSVGTGDYFHIFQSIEGYNVADLGWGAVGAKTVTLSFWVRSSLTGTFGGIIRNNAGTRSYPYIYTIISADTWEFKTVIIPGDTTGTWLTNNSTGILVGFGLGVGSTYSGTAGAWAGDSYVSATGATSVVGTSGATFYITGVQLEAGSVATPFERRPYGTELALCQRYYWTTYVSDPPGTIGAAGHIQWVPTATSSYGTMGSFSFPSQMRTSPTCTLYNLATGATGTFQSDGVTKAGVFYSVSRNHFSPGHQGVSVSGTTGNQFHVTAQAEL